MENNLDEFLSKLNPTFAKKIKTARDAKLHMLPTASKALNKKLGGGIGKGRVSLWFGNSSAGKSALALQSIGVWQKQGYVCAYIDVEGTYTQEWAEKLGVDNDELILVQGVKSAGRIEEIVAPLMDAEIDVVVIDSISDIMPEVFVDKEGQLNDFTDRKQVGAHAKAITALVGGLAYHNRSDSDTGGTALILISQVTTFMGQSYTELIPHGGKKTEHAASQIIRITSSQANGNQIEGEAYEGNRLVTKTIGRKVEFFVKKNKIAPPLGVGEWRFYFDGEFPGISQAFELLQLSKEYDIVVQSGAWFTWSEDGETILKIQGEKEFIRKLNEEPELFDRLTDSIAREESGEE